MCCSSLCGGGECSLAYTLSDRVLTLLQICLHFIISTRYNDFGTLSSHFSDLRVIANNTTAALNTTVRESSRHTFSFKPRANATFVLLCRNSDLSGVVSSIQQMEDRFNRQYKYPWVLLNEEPFTDDFKR